jgi:hypothetical protein
MINPTSNSSPLPRPNGYSPATSPASRRTVAAGDRLETASLDHLRASVAAIPAVRADVVELGRSLANDPGYPSDQIVEKLAALLVRQPDDDLDDSN